MNALPSHAGFVSHDGIVRRGSFTEQVPEKPLSEPRHHSADRLLKRFNDAGGRQGTFIHPETETCHQQQVPDIPSFSQLIHDFGRYDTILGRRDP
jgi:hypothetical protein